VRGTGETFIAIARWYTGNGNNWARLAQASPDIDPQRIHIGDVIRIPEEIVTTRRPMARSAPSATVGEKSVRRPRRASASNCSGPSKRIPARANRRTTGPRRL
jgi:hypothetical protein